MKMKNKRLEQISDKKKHLEKIKSSRRTQPSLERNEPIKLEKPTILIVCEGKNTEPSYFRQFELSNATVKPIGEGYNTLSLVERAIELTERKTFDQVWCVFDADPKPDNPSHAENFNKAIRLAQKQKFGLGYSNQAFEYWLILHFDDHQGGAMERSMYDNKINELLKAFGASYDGNGSKIISEKFFELLDGIDKKTNKPRKLLAIERAKRNHEKFDHSNPSKEESTTTVYLLVEELLKYK